MTPRAKLTPRQCEARDIRHDMIRAKIAKIHVAKKQLDMAEEDYRAMLVRITGNDSLTRCIEVEMDRVIDELRRLGFKDSRRSPARSEDGRALDTSPESTKIRALWLQLHAMGEVRNASEAALSAYVKRIGKVDDLRWLRGEKAQIVIETLKKWTARVEAARNRDADVS